MEDGIVVPKGKRYNSKYLLGNILVCGYCGAAYRRRIEKRRSTCADSPTLNEELVKEVLGEIVCRNGSYDEEMVRKKVDEAQVIDKHEKL